MAFKTQAEIYQALLDGKKIRESNFIEKRYVFLENGKQIDTFSAFLWAFDEPEKWSIYEEPKPKKKLTLYKHLIKHKDGSVYETQWKF